jgi:CheY-like chemotaxis protein
MKLLCIDDDPDDFMLFEAAVKLCDTAFQCIHASDGLHALTMLDTLLPDLIFLDNNMPYMNGKETLRCIRDINRLRDVPIYMLSTHIPKHDCEMFLSMGANGCLVKPGSFDQLCAHLQKVIYSHTS